AQPRSWENMKKASTRKVASTKGRSKPQTVDEYLATVPEPQRTTLEKVRAAIRAAVPAEATEVISYGIPAFKNKKVLIWFAAFSDHCSVFPTKAVMKAFEDDLKNYKIAKGTVQFPVDKPLPTGLLKKMVKARLTAIRAGKAR